MFLEHPEEKDLKDITLDEFKDSLMGLIPKYVQPERLNPEDSNVLDENYICPDPIRSYDAKITICESPTSVNK